MILTSTKGRFVRELEDRFAEMLGVRYVYACSSGTAAIHAAVAALDPEPGDEIVTSPITDMGALTPILYQGAIPVFAEVDPQNLECDGANHRAMPEPADQSHHRNPLVRQSVPMDEIMNLAESRDIPVIEDCAQAFLARAPRPLRGDHRQNRMFQPATG